MTAHPAAQALWPLPPERPGHPAPADLVALRAAADAYASEPDPASTLRHDTYGGIPCVVLEPAGTEPVATVLYLHGGGYRMGSAVVWAGLASRLAVAAGARVVSADYRLAPEHPYPACVVDACAAYAAVADRHGPAFVAGDSAGGGLAAAAALALAASGTPHPPPGLVMFSPWLDLTVTADSFADNAASDPYFSRESADACAALYLQGLDATTPLASPALAELRPLPPTLLFTSGAEVLLGDATAFTARAAAAGIAVEAHIAPGLPHVWPMVDPKLPESLAAVAAFARFVRAASCTTKPFAG